MKGRRLDWGKLILSSLFTAPFLAAWVQHVYSCLAADRWQFLIVGALLFPIGIVHGWGIWLGFW
jgi:hypothetical protein